LGELFAFRKQHFFLKKKTAYCVLVGAIIDHRSPGGSHVRCVTRRRVPTRMRCWRWMRRLHGYAATCRHRSRVRRLHVHDLGMHEDGAALIHRDGSWRPCVRHTRTHPGRRSGWPRAVLPTIRRGPVLPRLLLLLLLLRSTVRGGRRVCHVRRVREVWRGQRPYNPSGCLSSWGGRASHVNPHRLMIWPRRPTHHVAWRHRVWVHQRRGRRVA